MKAQDNMREELVNNAIFRMDESTRMIRKSIAMLKEEELWKKPNASSNSVGNLILHLCGNMHQYIIAGLGGADDIRDRDSEFNGQPDYSIEKVVGLLDQKLDQVKEVIIKCTAEDLLEVKTVQGFKLSGIGIIMHVVEHYSYHTGQIAFWIKLLRDQDLGFYDGIDLNTKND